jgi:hypothetical protein
MVPRRRVPLLLTFLSSPPPPLCRKDKAALSPDTYRELRWRYIGPEGNRVAPSLAFPAIRP